MQEDALKDHILRAELSERLEQSPCALITSRFGWTANMQRIIGSQTQPENKTYMLTWQGRSRKSSQTLVLLQM